MLFREAKYTRWYYDIIDRAKERSLTSYTEKHHIIAKRTASMQKNKLAKKLAQENQNS
jgi:hypothetical protein